MRYHRLQILASERERVRWRGYIGALRERKWRMGADGTETTGEMQLEKEGCERKPALVEIRRGGRWCAGGAGMGMGGEDGAGGGDGSGKRNPIWPV
jgi:hypothetical protein